MTKILDLNNKKKYSVSIDMGLRNKLRELHHPFSTTCDFLLNDFSSLVVEKVEELRIEVIADSKIESDDCKGKFVITLSPVKVLNVKAKGFKLSTLLNYKIKKYLEDFKK